MMSAKKTEYGDFQPPEELAIIVASFVRDIFPNPSVIVEPACGVGNFIKAALSVFNGDVKYYGSDVNENYIRSLRQTLITCGNDCLIKQSDFFEKDWKKFFSEMKEKKILIIGNPPWVTNSALGVLNSKNIPNKSNFQRHSGFAAKTGKANFDIAEWILIKIIENLKKKDACLAMLCKTATARKVLRHLWENEVNVGDSSLHIIDAGKYFSVSVGACLLSLIREQTQLQKTLLFIPISALTAEFPDLAYVARKRQHL